MAPSFLIRTYRLGDASRLADAWTESAPRDGITRQRFLEQVLLDRNFDRAGLSVAVSGGDVVGAAYAVRRRVAAFGSDTEPDSGWIPFFFVVPSHRHNGIGTALVQSAIDWLERGGATTISFSSYTPNYFLPGLDGDSYPDAARLLERFSFATQYTAVGMIRSLDDYRIPPAAAANIDRLRSDGYYLGEARPEDLVDLIEVATTEFNPDWGRAIREAYLQGMPVEQIIVVRDPGGAMLGWAMHGAYENVTDRFGPFGVLSSQRGKRLGEALLHVTLQHMRARNARTAWFLWTDESSPAGHLYVKAGFHVDRHFHVLQRAAVPHR